VRRPAPARRSLAAGLLPFVLGVPLAGASGCAGPPQRVVTYQLVEPTRTLPSALDASQLALAVVVATGHVVHSGDPDAPAGRRILLPEGLRKGGLERVVRFEPEAGIGNENLVLYAARPEDPTSPWALALEGHALELVEAGPALLSGPGWETELRLEVRNGDRGPEVVVYPGVKGMFPARPFSLEQGGYLWIGPRSGWERQASGTLITVQLVKRPG